MSLVGELHGYSEPCDPVSRVPSDFTDFLIVVPSTLHELCRTSVFAEVHLLGVSFVADFQSL